MIKPYREWSIRTKLTSTQSLTMLVVLVAFVAVYLAVTIKREHAARISRMEAIGELIAVNVASAVTFMDAQSANTTLNAVRTEPEIANAWIYDSFGNLFARYPADETDSFDYPFENLDGPEKRDGFLWMSMPIQRGDGLIGTLFLRITLARENRSIILSSVLAAALFLLGLLVVILLSIRFNRQFTRPILDLADAMEAAIETDATGARVETGNRDEIGKLYQQFNTMLDRLQEHQRMRDEVEEKLRRSERSLQEAQRIAKIGNWEYDLRREQTTWSHHLFDMFELDPQPVTTELFASMIHPDDRERVLQTMEQAIKRNQTATLEYRIRTASGKILHVYETGSEMRDKDGKVVRLVGTIQDITDRKAIEESIRRMNRELEDRVAERTAELEQAKERAESADQLKSAFLASMSHELRTPLNSIIGFTGILLQGLVGPLNDEQTKQLAMVKNSAHHLLDLINDVLDISKIEAGQLTVSHEPVRLDVLARETVDTLRVQAEKKGLELITDIPESLPVIMSDRRRVGQILINLMGNAIKFTTQGSVRVEITLLDHFIKTSVTDTGMGIKQEDMNKLFRPFQQIDAGLSRNHEGTGLGLSLSRKLLTLLGGTIEVTSQWNTGSTFSFYLPIIEPEKGGRHEQENSSD